MGQKCEYIQYKHLNILILAAAIYTVQIAIDYIYTVKIAGLSAIYTTYCK